MTRWAKNQIDRLWKTIVVFLCDACVVTLCFVVSFMLRFNTITISPYLPENFWQTLMIVVVVQNLCFAFFGMYRGMWRYSSLSDLLTIIKAASVAAFSTLILLFLLNRGVLIPRSIFIIDWLLLIVVLGGSRMTWRVLCEYVEQCNRTENRPILIVGAGASGEQLLRELRANPGLKLNALAFVDDDKQKHGRTLHGVPIMGGIDRIERIALKIKAAMIIIATPSATGKQMKRIVEVASKAKIEVKTLPAIGDIITGKIQVSQLREVLPADLLGRDPIQLDLDSIGQMITGKTILITGAGGSIGAELCRQIAKFKPQKLVLFEMCELFLFELENKLRADFPDVKVVPVIGNITNADRVEFAFKLWKPTIVFHAAAYKHVPMMESNPSEAVRTNVSGTNIIASTAARHGVERFVLISSDKAVNPTNVMGTTKRIAEMVCQHVQSKTQTTKFIIVRFGNVLGSSGSVIPTFKRQIEAGGPITITHPDITRYFMSIPEAAQLVIQAGTMGKGGEIFVLDMGEPVKILDLAKQMIQLTGLEPYKDIDISIVGLRPGEKLYEELLADEETTLPTCHKKVRVASVRSLTPEFERVLNNLTELEDHSERKELRKSLSAIVPEYLPTIN